MKTEERVQKHEQIARRAGLSCPKGRAVALENRLQQGGTHIIWEEDGALKLMRRFQLATAERWLRHWKLSGSIRSLMHTREQYNARRRAEHAARVVKACLAR